MTVTHARSDLRRAVFLDRDGVINVHRDDYVKGWHEFRFLADALRALKQLASLDVLVIVVTNQSVIDRGIVSRATLDEMHRRMRGVIHANCGRIDDVYFCPHLPQIGCACRKPASGLLLRAAEEHGIDLSRSFIVGDRWSDMTAGRNVGCRGYWITADQSPEAAPDVSIVSGLGEAVSAIVNDLADEDAFAPATSSDRHAVTVPSTTLQTDLRA